jgi:hypothetical protein
VLWYSAKVVLGPFHLLWKVVHMSISQLLCCEFMIVFYNLTWSQIWDLAKGEERESHLHKWVEFVNQRMGFLKLPFTHFLILILRFLIEPNLKMKIVSKLGNISPKRLWNIGVACYNQNHFKKVMGFKNLKTLNI